MDVDNREDRRCLLRLASRLHSWKHLGLWLTIPQATISFIEAKQQLPVESATEMLFGWAKESATGTRQTLVEALADAGRRDLAEELIITGTFGSGQGVR